MNFPDPDDDEPLFDSVEEMCDAYGWSDEVPQQIERDIELTRQVAPDDTVH